MNGLYIRSNLLRPTFSVFAMSSLLMHLLTVSAEKVEAEFGERLVRLGPKATAQTLASLLSETVSGSTTLAHPTSAARTAHVLIIAALNLVRVEVAPLPQSTDLPPLAFLMAQQQVKCLSMFSRCDTHAA